MEAKGRHRKEVWQVGSGDHSRGMHDQDDASQSRLGIHHKTRAQAWKKRPAKQQRMFRARRAWPSSPWTNEHNKRKTQSTIPQSSLVLN